MPRSIAIVVGLLTLVAPAIAERGTPPADDLWGAGAAGGNASRASYLEDFESFAVGGLAGHQGWSGWASNIRVIDDTPIGGMRSARHTSDGSGFVGFEIVSPTFTPAYGVLAATLRLSGANVTYQFNALGDQPTGHDGFYFNTAVQFRTDGTIAALQAAGGVGVFQDTAGTWTPGVPFQIAVEVLPDGVLNVYKDGADIFAGMDIGFVMTGTAGRTQQYLGWADNAIGSAGQSMTVDDFTNVLVPEPAALAIACACLAARRR